MKARVHVFLKPGVLDPQGAAIANSLRHLGFEEVGDARQGKLIEIDLDAESEDAARARVEAMCERLLANPVIENYAVEISA